MAFADDLTTPPGGILPGDELLLIRPGTGGAPARAYSVPPSALAGGGGTGQPVGLGFVIPGKVGANAAFYLPMAFPCTIPANLAGTVVYCTDPPTADATFYVEKASHLGDGTYSTFGTIRMTAGSHFGAVLQSTYGQSLDAGDVLVLALPTDQDATLANVGITILAQRGLPAPVQD